MKTIKSYCPWFPDKGFLDLEVWEKVGQKFKWYQENGTPIGYQNLITWSLGRMALIPIHPSKPHDQENLEEKGGICRATAGIVVNLIIKTCCRCKWRKRLAQKQ